MSSLKLNIGLLISLIIAFSLTGLVMIFNGQVFFYKAPVFVEESNACCVLVTMSIDSPPFLQNFNGLETIHFSTMRFMVISFTKASLFIGLAQIDQCELFLNDIPHLKISNDDMVVNNALTDFNAEFIDGNKTLNMNIAPKWIKSAKGTTPALTWHPTDGIYGLIILNSELSNHQSLKYYQGIRNDLEFYFGFGFLTMGLIVIFIIIFSMIRSNWTNEKNLLPDSSPSNISSFHEIIVVKSVYKIDFCERCGFYIKNNYRFRKKCPNCE
ncbi:MAG: hypothetical protein ACFFDT_31815 [Candidatus Hodarchaeota archaeon]